MLIPISPGESLAVNLTVTDYTDPATGAVAPGLTVTARLSDVPHGAAIDPGCVYPATEIGPAPSGYSGTVYRIAIDGSTTLAPLGSRIGRTVYLNPSVNGAPCDPRDIVALIVKA